MMKKILSVLLAAAMQLTLLAVPVSAAAPEFSDTKGHWAEEAIDQWTAYDVVHGYGNGKFRPDAPMTRAEFSVALVNLLGIETYTHYNPYKDIKSTEWYYQPMLKLYYAGVMKGDERAFAMPNQKITREEALVMIGRSLGVKPSESADFTAYDDGSTVSSWARGMLGAMVEKEYIKGVRNQDGTVTLKPEARIDRASVMQVLSNTVTNYITEPGSYQIENDGFTIVKTPEADVTVTGNAAGIIVSQVSKGSEVTVDNSYVAGSVKVQAPDATVVVKDSKIETIDVSRHAEGTTIQIQPGTTVDKLATEAKGVTVEGEGELKQAEVTGGKGDVAINTPGTTVAVDESAKDANVSVGGETVKPGESATGSGTGDGYTGSEPAPDDTPGGGGGGGGSVPPANNVIVTLDYQNGGTNGSITITKGQAIDQSSLPTPQKTGYTFSGWYQEAACTTAWDFTTVVDNAVTLYADWTAIGYTVTFNSNANNSEISGTAVGGMTLTYDTPAQAPACTWTRTGYTFVGWNTASDGTGTAYAAGAELLNLSAVTATIPLYAIWEEELPSSSVAQIGTSVYPSLADAVAAVNPGSTATIKLLQDHDFAGPIEIRNCTITLDLNGKTLTHTGSGHGINIGPKSSGSYGPATVTIQGNGAFKSAAANNMNMLSVRAGSTLTIVDGTYTMTAATGKSGKLLQNHGATTIRNGTFSNRSTSSTAISDNLSVLFNAAVDGGAGSFTINGGTFNGSTVAGSNSVLQNGEGGATAGTVTITAGAFNGAACVMAHGSGGKIDISGGTFTATHDAAVNGSNATNQVGKDYVINISGGTFTGYTGVYMPVAGTVTISGSANLTGTQNGVAIRGGTLNVQGGTIACSTARVTDGASESGGSEKLAGVIVLAQPANAYMGAITVNVTGGTLSNSADSGCVAVVDQTNQTTGPWAVKGIGAGLLEAVTTGGTTAYTAVSNTNYSWTK